MPSLSGHYQAFGLRWQSSLPLPELRVAPDDSAAVAVEVRVAPAPAPDEPEIVPGVRAGARRFWMEVPAVARLLVEDGAAIVVEPAPGAAAGDVRAFLLGSAAGALLHQRGLLPLHASAVEFDGRAVAFVAPSGGGKSTIAMHLHQRGHRVIADDLCAIELVDGRPRLWPGLRNLKLWRASLDAAALTPDGLEPVLAQMDKYRLPAAALAEHRPFDLAGVVELGWGGRPALRALPGAAAVGVLVANTFRGQLVAAMGRDLAHWRQCVDAATAGVHRLDRPRALDRLAAAAAPVLERFAGAATAGRVARAPA